MAACTVNCRAFFVVFTTVLLLSGTEVRGHVGQVVNQGGPVRTVMDLMEVMLSQDILDMLKNGGFDFRQPARIFLPPKFYSVVPLDHGHMHPDEILRATKESVAGGSRLPTLTPPSPSPPSVAGKADHQKPSGAVGKPFGGLVGATGGSRINLISYSDGKVKTAGAGTGTEVDDGRWATVGNKGSETLEKNVGTNVNAVPVSGRSGIPTAGSRTRATPANEQQQQQQHRRQHTLTTSITDQTVSQNVGRTLPTSGRAVDVDHSTTDRLRSALPGEPDVDYPILGSVPSTQFSCDKRHHGYYADVETRCQVFRVCANTDSTGRGFAFLCPNGTLFNQRHLVCDWYMNVRCEESENFYHVNEDIGRMGTGRPMVSDNRNEMMKVVMSMVTYPMRSLMEMMDGVGVIEQRGVGLEVGTAKPTLPAPGYSGFVNPASGLQPPFSHGRLDANGGLNNDVPVLNNYTPAVGPRVPVTQNQASNVYTPKLDNVYVSNLGTLSTDPDSGFDPLRSTLLTRTDGTVSQVSQVPQSQSYGVSNNNQPAQLKTVANDVQLIRANLVKSWNDQSNRTPQQQVPLRLNPVSQPASTRSNFHPFVAQLPGRPHHPTVNGVSGRGSILPPTGVLPPSTFTRTVTVGPSGYAGALPNSALSAHRFAPVRKVLPIQKVTVVPESSYHTLRNMHELPGNFYHAPGTSSVGASNPTQLFYQTAQTSVMEPSGSVPTQGAFVQPTTAYVLPEYLRYTGVKALYSAPPVAQAHSGYGQQHVQHGTFPEEKTDNFHHSSSAFVAATPQIHRRGDTVSGAPVTTGLSSRRQKSTTVLQVVPSLSFYLNDAEEKREFDEAVRQGLFDERRRRTYTSYDVPLGSVGMLPFTH